MDSDNTANDDTVNGSLAAEPDNTVTGQRRSRQARADRDIERMRRQVVRKTWHIPAYEGKGPVSVALSLPEVRITDSEGRYILISPRQQVLLSARMAGIHDWLTEGDADYEPDEEELLPTPE